mgnify:CR=1 FL=1
MERNNIKNISFTELGLNDNIIQALKKEKIVKSYFIYQIQLEIWALLRVEELFNGIAVIIKLIRFFHLIKKTVSYMTWSSLIFIQQRRWKRI